MRFSYEAKHVETVSNGGALSVLSRLHLVHVQKGDCGVVHTAEVITGEGGEKFLSI